MAIEQEISNIPRWMPSWIIVVSIVLSFLLTILKIFESISKGLKRGTLDFRITSELFLRILENGECFYTHCILVGRNQGVLIEEATAELTLTGNANKTFDLDIIVQAEKTKDGSYNLFSNSPLAFLPEERPERITYLCCFKNYCENIKKAYTSFNDQIYKLKEKYIIPSQDEDTAKDLIIELDSIIKTTCESGMEAIQIEPGKYKLTISLTYSRKGFLWESKKTVKRSVMFSFDNEVRDSLRCQIKDALSQTAKNIFTDNTTIIRAPQYT